MCKEGGKRPSWFYSLTSKNIRINQTDRVPGHLIPRNFQEVYKDLIKANGLASNKSFRA